MIHEERNISDEAKKEKRVRKRENNTLLRE